MAALLLPKPPPPVLPPVVRPVLPIPPELRMRRPRRVPERQQRASPRQPKIVTGTMSEGLISIQRREEKERGSAPKTEVMARMMALIKSTICKRPVGRQLRP